MMKHTDLKTHWTPEQAEPVLHFLEELKDLIWQSYEHEILDQLHPEHMPSHDEQGELPFDDPIVF